MSGGYASSGFEIGNVLDQRAYPTARRNRPGPPPSSAPAADVQAAQANTPPVTRAFWFELRTNATSRTTISTPRLRGPLIVKEIQWGTGSPPDATAWYLDIGKATTPVSEVNVAVGAARPWTSLFADMVPRSANVAADLIGMPSRTQYGAVADDRWRINQLIPDLDVFLVLSVLNTVAAARVTHGTFYVIEGIALDQAALYLG